MKIPGSVDLKKDGRYCINCFSKEVRRSIEQNKTYYFCDNCGNKNERCLVIDKGIDWWIDSENNYWHASVGALILNEKSEILCIKRRIYPFAFALPAGHLDRNEKPAEAVQREVEEEVGLHFSADAFKLVAVFDLPGDSCRRGSDHHRWHLYKASIKAPSSPLVLNDEAEDFSWLSAGEIQRTQKEVVYPLYYIAKKFEKEIS